jgi:hypothetical protein
MVEATLPSSPAPQVTVTTTYTAAPLATSVAVLTLIEGSLLAVADARAAVAGEAVAASAVAGISAAAQAMTATAVRRFGDRELSCMVSSFDSG